MVRLAIAGAALWLPATLPAQQLGVDVTSAQQESGIDLGNYHTNFDIEAGYRFVGTEGNASMYSTWVNMQQGPRILSSNLSMRSLNHDGFLFDRLNMSSFWLYAAGGLVMVASFFVRGGAPNSGWTSYPPLADVATTSLPQSSCGMPCLRQKSTSRSRPSTHVFAFSDPGL